VRYRRRRSYDLATATAAVEGLDDIKLLCCIFEATARAAELLCHGGRNLTEATLADFGQRMATGYMALNRRTLSS
jgi:hypothetical protein